MPITMRTVLPLGLSAPDGGAASAGKADLKWLRWVAGRPSEWKNRGTSVVGNQLVLNGCTSKAIDANADQTFTYDLTQLQWQSHTSEGLGPIDAAEHISVSIGNTIFVFWWLYDSRSWGPYTDHPGQFICSLQTTSTMSWSAGEFQGNAPRLTRGFTATHDGGNRIILFGGEDDLSQLANHVTVLDLSEGRYNRIQCDGEQPPPRTMHSAMTLPENSLRGGNAPGLLIWGGQSSDESLLNDMFILSYDTWTWRAVYQQGVTPVGRMGHTMFRIGGYLVLKGGCTPPTEQTSGTSVFNLACSTWLTDVNEFGEIPPNRYGSYATPILDGKSALLFGGYEPATSEQVLDVYCLECDISRGWSDVDEPSPDDDDFLSMPQQVQLLSLEKERLRLQEDNRKLRTFEDNDQRLNLKRAIEGERRKWDNEKEASDRSYVDEISKLNALTTEATTRMQSAQHENELSEQEIQQLKEQHFKDDVALDRQKAEMHSELADIKAQHEREFDQERQRLDDEAEALRTQEHQLKQQIESERETLSQQQSAMKEQLQQEASELQSMRAQLNERERELDELIHRERMELDRERRDIDRMRQELERERLTQEDLYIKKQQLDDEKERLENLSQSLKNERDAMNLNTQLADMSAVPVDTFAPDGGGIPLSCQRFLTSSFNLASQILTTPGMSLPCLFTLLKKGGLMRGVITIDLVLDIVHAAQAAVHPNETGLPKYLDCDVFMAVVVDIIHRLYGSPNTETVDMTVVEYIIEDSLRRSWNKIDVNFLNPNDEIFNEICSLPVAEVLHSHRETLIQLFKRFALLNSGNTMSKDDLMCSPSPYEFITVLQVINCLEAMKVIPHLVSSDTLRSSYITNDEMSLHELSELICRLALIGFNDQAPSEYKISRLLDSSEVKDAATTLAPSQTSMTSNKAITPIRGRPSQIASLQGQGHGSVRRSQSPVRMKKLMQPSECQEMLLNKNSLRQQLQRIYLYYSSLPGGKSTDLTNSNWERLCKDIGCLATHMHFAGNTPSRDIHHSMLLTRQEIERIYTDSKSESKSFSNSPALNFDGFMIALKRLSQILCKGDAASGDALHSLLLNNVLPFALRAPSTLFESEITPIISEILHQHKRSIDMMYQCYGPGSGGMLAQFLRLLIDFKIIPSLLSKTEGSHIHKVCTMTSPIDDEYKLFQRLLVSASYLAFSKHPYSSHFRSSVSRLTEFFDKIGALDASGLKHTLEGFGFKISYPKTTSQQSSKPETSYRHAAIPLNDERQLDKALKDVFAAYSHLGKMSEELWVKLSIDSKVAHPVEFPRHEVEVLFRQACQSGVSYLTFDEWCDVLLTLGQKRFPSSHHSAALRLLLSSYILPNAERHVLNS